MEEKKNTMENMTKEQAAFDYSGWSRDALIYHIMTLENKLASGSVAAPKPDTEDKDYKIGYLSRLVEGKQRVIAHDHLVLEKLHADLNYPPR